MKNLTWPAWFSSPDGKSTAVFGSADDVPKGWTSGAEKQAVEGKSAPASRKKQDDPLDL